jgi:outer membrane protein OmpA-like peptidoglycan-associated protein
MGFDLRKGGEDATGAAKSKRPLWLLAIAGCVVLIAIAAWYFWQRSPEGVVGNPPGPQAGTTDATKPATPPATTPPTVASKTEVGTADQPSSAKTQATADQPSSAAVASAKKPISSSQQPDAATGAIPVRFQAGSSSVTAPDSAVVAEILTYLSAHPTSKATVSGYASSEGDLATNEALAKERADAFKAYLVGRGVTAERIIAVGRGIERPVASNDSQQGRAKNRRVEVIF